MIGVGAGIENNGINQSSKLIIFIPFVTFTFYDKYKKDRKPTNTKI